MIVMAALTIFAFAIAYIMWVKAKGESPTEVMH